MVRVPLWIRLVDAATLIIAAVLVWKIVSADTRAGVFGLIPHVRTSFLVYTVAGLVAVRHIVMPRPSAFARLRAVWSRVSTRPDWGTALRIFLGTRLLVFVVAFFAVATFGIPSPGVVLTGDELLNLPMRFDAGWYGGIALEGYDPHATFDRQRNIAFFPAMPMLMRAIGPVFGSTKTGLPIQRRMVRVLWAGVFLSLCAFLISLVYLIRLGSDLVGDERAPGAALLLATYPFACFFNAPYTEAVFLLATVGAAYHFRHRQWAFAGAWGLLAGLTRPNGFLLSVPLGLLWLQQLLSRGREPQDTSGLIKGLGAASMPVTGMLAFTAYLYTITGVWFAWARSHEAWGRNFTGLQPLNRGFQWLVEDGLIDVAMASPVNFLNTVAALFALSMTWAVARRVGIAWAAYVLVILLPPIFAGGALSLGRVTSTLFPVFLALAVIITPRSVPSLAAGFALLQGLCAALFFTWRDLY